MVFTSSTSSSSSSSAAPYSASTNTSSSYSSLLSDRSRPKDGATPTTRKTASPTSLNDLLGLADDSRTLDKLGGDYGRTSPPHSISCIVYSLTVGFWLLISVSDDVARSVTPLFNALFELGRIPPRLSYAARSFQSTLDPGTHLLPPPTRCDSFAS